MSAMGLQEDLEAFRELAFDEQARLNTQDDPDVQEVYDLLDPLLAEIVGDRKICLSGAVVVPVINEDQGRVVGDMVAEEPVEGWCNGLFVAQHDEVFGDTAYTRNVVGYSAYLGTYSSGNHVHTSQSRLLAFAPIEDCHMSVPDAELAGLDVIMPADDDEIAAEIDEIVLNAPISFTRLNDIFAEIIRTGTDLELDYYLGYLNTVFNMDDLNFDLVTASALQLDEADQTAYEVLDDDQAFEIEGQALGFRCFLSDDTVFLCLQLDATEHGYGNLLLPVTALLSAKVSTSKTVVNNTQ